MSTASMQCRSCGARVERMVAWARSLGGAKLITNPIQVFFRDLMLPIFLKREANPTTLDWIYAYDVEWDAPIAVAHAGWRVTRR
jgi:hypothetical protein